MATSNKADEMACRELVEKVSAYLDGSLAPEDRRRFDEHLKECPWCVNYVEQMRETVAALGELSVDSIPPENRREIVDAFRDWRQAG
jgi:anti-sigma factor RsiW